MTTPQTTYGRLQDGKLVEYPVFDTHIENRGHPKDWYTPVSYLDKQEHDQFSYLREIPEVIDKTSIVVRYVVELLPLESLLQRLPKDIGSITSPNEAPSPELISEIQSRVIDLVEQRLDAFAATRGYGNSRTSPIVSASSFATSSDPKHGPEGRYCVQARDDTWNALWKYWADILKGVKGYPTSFNDVVEVLPPLKWPDL